MYQDSEAEVLLDLGFDCLKIQVLIVLRSGIYPAESINSSKNKKSKIPLFVVEADTFLSKLESVSKRSKSTIENISNSLSKFANYMINIQAKDIAIEKFGIDLCTADNVLLWLQYEMNECKNSARTRNLKLSHIREFMFDVSNRYPLYGSLYINLMNITPLREEEKTTPCLTDEQVVDIIKVAVTMNKGVRNGSMLLLMSETAVRVHELVSTKVRDLDLSDEHPRLQVMGKGRKYRVIPLNSDTLKVRLSTNKCGINDPLFNLSPPFLSGGIKEF